MHNSDDDRSSVQDPLARALAEPTRRAILENLRLGKKTVTELVHATRRKQPNLSNHLAKMRQQGLVFAERRGRQVYYSLNTPFADVLLGLFETAALPALETGTPAQRGMAPDPASAFDDDLATWREQFLQGLLCGQEEQIASVVNDMLAQRLDLLTIYLQVFQPALYRIGELYARGEITVAQEHLASAYVERMMARVAQFYTPVRRVPWRALMGCVAHNWHVIGLRMLADALRIEGWEILFLGANVPTSSFVDMAARTHPDLIVISCSLREHLPTALDLVTQLNHLRGTDPERQFQIAVGGNHLFEVRETLQAQGVNLMAPDLRTFLQEVHRLFAP